jgi:hypothetical protein
MADEARHHHYIPQAYLRGFSQKRGARQWLTHVMDLQENRSYPTNIRNVCGERDFMRVEMEGLEPNRVEKEMSNFETKCIEAIRDVAETSKFEGECANLTLNLMALLAVRSPEMRENMRGFHEQVAKRVMDLTLQTKERWEGQMAQMVAKGGAASDVTYEDMKAFHEGQNYVVDVRREFHMQTEFQLMSDVLELLGKRLWTLYTTDGSYGEFITTNRPVTLTFIEPEKVPPFYRHSPGFAVGGTEVFFPLTRYAVLVGRWDRGGNAEVATQSFIAAVNTHLTVHSYGKVFSRQKEFLYVGPRGKIYWDGSFLVRRKEWKSGSGELS